jgi:peptide/nickel transport system substrate-binding protein
MASRASWLAGFRSLRIVMLLAILLASAPAMSAQDASPAPGGGSGGTMVGAFDAGPGGCVECFNPLQATAGFTWLEKYFSKLVLYNVDFTEVQGELADSWDISDDGTAYTFHLREGVKWHDGEDFTSDDVKFTIELAQNPDSASWIGAKFAGVSSIEAPDPLTVVLKLDAPNAAILDALTFLVMLPQHALADIPAADLIQSDWWSTNPIGTGPFKWSEYKPGEYVELVAFDDYFRGRPQLDSIINRYYPEPGSSVIALRSGEIQFSYLTSDEAASLEGEAGLTMLSGPSQVANYLGFDLTEERFQDPKVRQAFMYAIDRGVIVDQLYGGGATVLSCALSNEIYVPGDLNDYAYDVEQARTLLEEANWEETNAGEPIEIVTYYEDQLSNDVLVTIQQFLADAGVEVTLRFVDTPTYNELITTTDWNIFYGGGANGPDPDVTRPYFTGPEPPDGVNRVRLESPEMEDLYTKGQQETDPEARAAIYQDICRWQNENQPWGFLWVAERYGAYSSTVENFVWTPAPGGGRYYDAAETWAMPAQ